MQTQKIFQAGNSEVIAIPEHIKKDLKLKKGNNVVVERLPGEDAFIVKKVTKSKLNKSAVGNEFSKWLKNVITEDEQILNELAIR